MFPLRGACGNTVKDSAVDSDAGDVDLFNRVTVTWEPPETGTAGLNGWLLQWRPEGSGSWTEVTICDVGDRSHTLTGLDQDVEYEAQVFPLRGTCKDFAAVSGTAAGTALDKPDRMTGVSLTSGIGFVTVSWTAPASDGGSSITRYEIQHKAANEAGYTLVRIEDATVRTHTFRGLEEGIELTVQVRAVNAALTGDWSAAMTATPNDLVPPAFSDARLSADDDGSFKLVTIRFDESLDSGSAPAAARFGVNVGADGGCQPVERRSSIPPTPPRWC